MRRFIQLLTIAAMLCMATASYALVPGKMTLQGHLRDGNTPVTGTRPVQFTIYNAEIAGASIWTESGTLNAQDGLFTSILGETSPLPASLFTGQVYWLEINVDGTILLPRRPMGSVAYSFRAQNADTANFALNSPAGDNLWSTDGTNVWRPSGNVGLGMNTPNYSLDIRSPDPTKGLNWEVSSGAEAGSYVRFGSNNSRGAMWIGNPSPYGNTPADEAGLLQTTGGWQWTKQLNIMGSVGVGTNSPNTISWFGAPAVVVSGSRPTFSLAPDQPGGLGTIQFSGPQSQFHINYADAPMPFVDFGTGCRIFNNGVMGLGVQDPQATLHVAGNAIVNNLFANGDGSFQRPGGSSLVIQTPASDVRVFSTANVPLNLGTNGNTFMLTINPNGQVHIPGSLDVTGSKCRVVDSPEFGKLYYHATESASPLFSVEGEGQLKNGHCTIELDPKWLAGVTIDDAHPMQVTIGTFYGPHGGQEYVQRTNTGFTVIDPSGSNASFGWKVEARQKGYEDLYLNQPAQTAAK